MKKQHKRIDGARHAKRRRYTDEEIIRRARQGLALNIGELAVAMGYGYSTVQKWHKEGMPLYDGRTFLSDAKAWVKRHRKSALSQLPNVDLHPLLAKMRQ